MNIIKGSIHKLFLSFPLFHANKRFEILLLLLDYDWFIHQISLVNFTFRAQTKLHPTPLDGHNKGCKTNTQAHTYTHVCTHTVFVEVFRRKSKIVIYALFIRGHTFFFNWDSLKASLNSHSMGWCYKIKSI